jgi:PAS domain-containing protein
MLLLAVLLASAIGLLAGRIELPSRIGGLLQTLLLGALAYTVLRTRLFMPTRAALDLAIQAMSEAIAVLDQAGKVIYANPRAAALGPAPGRTAETELREAGAEPFELASLLAQTERTEHGAPQALTLSAPDRVLVGADGRSARAGSREVVARA